MDPFLPLTLYWRGLRLSRQNIYDLLAMGELEQDAFLAYRFPKTPKDWRKIGETELNWLRQKSVQIIPFWDPRYPEDYLEVEPTPLVLTVMGELPLGYYASLAVVGSRNLAILPPDGWSLNLTVF